MTRANLVTPSSARPHTTLLICSRNRPQLLQETIESVLAGQAVPDEILIVDQSATANATLAAFTTDRPCTIRYVSSPTTGLSTARNIAIREAANELLVIIDDDMFVEQDWFAALTDPVIAEGPTTIVTGRVMPTDAELPGGFVPALKTDRDPARYSGRQATDVLAGGHMAAYQQTLLDFGGFDERLGAGAQFPAADDNDLGLRLLDAGITIRYVPEAVVYHRAWRPQCDFVKMRWAYGRGQGGFYAKHLSICDPRMFKRLGRDIWNRTRRAPGRLRTYRVGALGDAVFVAGVAVGMIRWLVGVRLLPRLRRRGVSPDRRPIGGAR